MATSHSEHGQSVLDLEEHSRIGGIDGKKMFVFDDAGNQITSFGGAGAGLATVDIRNTINANVSLSNSISNIGFATVWIGTGAAYIGLASVNIGGGNVGITGNVTLSDSKTYIGLTTTTLGAGLAGIGFATVALGTGGVLAGLSSTATIYAIANTLPLSFYTQSSLISGYVYYGFATPNSNPTTNNFKIQRETLLTGEVLFAGGSPQFIHRWSAASIASVSYL